MDSYLQSISRYFLRILALSLIFIWTPSIAVAANEMQISISGPDADGITRIGICFTNPAELGSSVSYVSTNSSGSFRPHSGTPSCPSFASGSTGSRLTSGQTYTYDATATSGGRTYSASRTYTAPGEDPALVAARQLRESQDADFRNRQEAARAAAQVESQAWNAANPGQQKCVQWGPIVHANGVSTASGGVCANPVEAGPNTSVQTQSAPSVEAPPTSTSTTSTSPTSNDTSTTTTSTSNSTGSTGTTSGSSSSTSTPQASTEDFSKWGSGTPFTKVLKGQLSTSECPSGYQGANGIIVAIGTGTFTECWPENAWAAYRLGGSIWEQFKSSGGTYDAKAESDRRNRVTELKALAKSVAQTAADQTPGIQRCSKWSGYGETGQECAYTFVKPSASSSNTSTGVAASETSTATSSTSPKEETKVGSTAVINDPFPNLINGDEIPNTRITSQPGVKQIDWEQTSTFKSFSCPAGSGRATGVDLNFTVAQSDDRWFAYCVKSIQSSTSSTNTSIGSKGGTETSTATSSTTPSTTPSTTSSNSTASTDKSPTLQSTSIEVKGSVSELKSLVGKVVEDKKEAKAISTLINRLDSVISKTSLKQIKLPGSNSLDESAESKTPNICTVKGVSVTSLGKGNCIIAYTVTDSDGNTFTTEREIYFRK